MESALQISQLITNIIIILLFLCIIVGIIKVLGQLRRTSEKFDEITGSIKDFQNSMKPVIEKASDLLDTSKNIAKKIDDNVDKLKTVTDNLKTVADNVIEFEEKLRSKIEPPVLDTIASYSAIVKGVKAFVEKFKSFRASDNSLYDDEFEYGHDEDNYSVEIEAHNRKIDKEVEDLNFELKEVRKKTEALKK